MSATTTPTTIRVYQLKVSLRDISPMIWRRLLVTSETTIAQLHDIVQIAMGWEDLHLHQYRDGGISFADNPYQVMLAAFKLRKGERFIYEYDMGDFWQHDIRLEEALPLDANTHCPVCTAGAGDCPPEDCGGPEGYRSLLDERCSWSAVHDVQDDMAVVAQRLLDWYQGGPRPTYDDDEFSAAFERMRERLETAPITFNRRTVNAALRALGKKRKEMSCASASRSLPSRTMARNTCRRSPL